MPSVKSKRTTPAKMPAPPAESPDALLRRESVRSGLLRISRRHVTTALQRIDHPKKADRTEDIHQVRVHGKRLRALLRLLKPVTNVEAVKRENARLREVGRSLAGFRDTFVAGQTFQNIFEDAAPRQMKDAARLLGVKPHSAKSKADLAVALKAAAKSLRRTADEIRRLPISARGWAAIAPGLEKSYRRARADYKKCAQHGAGHLGDCFHAWRKRVKDLGYQLEILANLPDKDVQRLRKDFRRLGALLGDDHDYLVFAERVREREAHYEDLANFRPVRKRLKRRLKELRAKEFGLAKALFADKPGIWITLLYDHWRGWKNPNADDLVLTIERVEPAPSLPARSLGTPAATAG
jgi:CHAD domain-containing protein